MHMGCLNGTVLKEVVVWKSKSLKPCRILIKRFDKNKAKNSIEEFLPEIEPQIL